MNVLGAQSSVLCVVFSGVDIVLVVGIAQVISFAAWRYRTFQIYPKCSIDRLRQGLGYEGIGGPIKRAQLRFRYVLTPFWL